MPPYNAAIGEDIALVRGAACSGSVEALRSTVPEPRRKLGDDAKKPRYVIGGAAPAAACRSPMRRDVK